MLCVSMKILSHASAKKKPETIKGVKCYTFIGHFQVTSWQCPGAVWTEVGPGLALIPYSVRPETDSRTRSSLLVALSTQPKAKLDNYHCVQGLRTQEQCEQKLGLGSLSFPIPVGLKQTAGHDRVDWWRCPPSQRQNSIIITVYRG